MALGAVAVALPWAFGGGRSAEAAVQQTTIRWGPYNVPAASGGNPGMTNNGLDVGVQKPCINCYVVAVEPNLVYPDGTTINFTNGGMLHHMVLFSDARQDASCGNSGVGQLGDRIFASGNERTIFALPDGYGYYVSPGESWTVLHDIMNMTPTVQSVYLEFTISYRPGSDSVNPVTPLWLDVDNCADSEYSIPAGYSDTHWDWTSTLEGDVVSIGGHVHDYGISVAAERVQSGQYLCASVAGYADGSSFAPAPVAPGDAGHPGQANLFNPGDPTYAGHIEDMTGCAPILHIWPGDTVRLHSQYNAPSSHNDVMGIMVAYVHETTSTPTPAPTGTATPTPTPTDGPTPLPTPTPGPDSDGDGCTDAQENGPDEELGGRRDPANPWDFYDINGDRMIDLFFDIFGVAELFGADADNDPPGEPDGYDPMYDRSAPPVGADPWDMQAPDGTIDMFTDVFGAAGQFGHSCQQ